MDNKEKKAPLHMVITDNETDEIIVEHDFDALVGAVHLGENKSQGLSMLRGSMLTLAATVMAAEHTIAHTEQRNPAVTLAKSIISSEEIEEEIEEENEEKGEE